MVCDGGSTDGTWERIQWWASQHSIIRAIQRIQDNPPSLSVQLNHAMDQATGRWIIIMDTDQFLSRGTTKDTLLRLVNQPDGIDGVKVIQYRVLDRNFKRRSMADVSIVALHNRPGVRWWRPIHQLPTLKDSQIAFSNLTVLIDYGWTKSVETRRKKWKTFYPLKNESWKLGIPITEAFYTQNMEGKGDLLEPSLVPDLKALGWDTAAK